jgi:hypothetical protein
MTDSDRLRIELENRFLVAALSKISQNYAGSALTDPHASGGSKNTFVIRDLSCLVAYALQETCIGHRCQPGNRV